MQLKNNIFKLIISLVIIIIGAYILSIKFIRFDLTSEGRYTLSEYTKNILENLNDKVYIKVYLEGEGLPTTLKNYNKEIKEELDEFKVYTNNNLEYEFINPSESKDKEIRFSLYKSLSDKGIIPIQTNEVTEDGKSSQKMVFPGAIISYKGKEITVKLLKSAVGFAPESEENVNNSIQSLEYELTNAIQKLSKNKKTEIAFIEGQGELNEYEVMDISSILSEYYTVKTGKINATPGILDNFKAIIIAKPKKPFSEQDKFVIDQYIMNGGNVMILAEGCKTNTDSLFMLGSTISLPQDLNLNDMLFQYGARINNDLLLDKYSSPIGLTTNGANDKPIIKRFPWYYFPVLVTENNHVISKYLNYIKTEYISTIDTVGKNSKVKKTVLLKSSPYTKLDPIPARIGFNLINHMPADNEMVGGKKNIAVLLEGNFTSIFKNRPIQKYFPNVSLSDIKVESKAAKIIIVSDGDIIKNEVSKNGKPYPIGFDKFTQQTFKGNQEFILNSLNYLCDDEGLMTIRSRELKMRLLSNEKVSQNKITIQILNVIIPIIIILVFGAIVLIIRKQKYKQ